MPVKKEELTPLFVKHEHKQFIVNIKPADIGKHVDHDMCLQCRKYSDNIHRCCVIANGLRSMQQQFGVIVPVWGCSRFIERGIQSGK